MAETETTPRRQLIIKLYLPRSEKRGPPPSEAAPDAPCKKMRKVGSDVSAAKPRSKTQCYNTEYPAVPKIETPCGILKGNIRAVSKHPRTVSKEGEMNGAANSRSKKMRKVDTSEVSVINSECPTKSLAVGKSGTTQCGVVKQKCRSGSRIPGTGCNGCKLKKEKGVECKKEKKKLATEVVSTMARSKTQWNTEYPKSFALGKRETHSADSRNSRSGSEECKKEKKTPRVEQMDRYKKMQCWVILKRLMIGRDGWAFKQSQFLKDLEILDKSDDEAMSKPTMGLRKIKSELSSTVTILKPIGLEEIESKLNKRLYSGPDEFADDMRLVFSYALLNPPRNEIYRIAKRLSENFEFSWKSLKEKWSTEERKGKKTCKREVCPKVDRDNAAREV